ncbi:MAG: 50S ribosomal protein L23 [Candidatus Melainabacteria bacterium]|nr:50S ribosomal protein L23 [Candidatus Melainabacteria bacterium]
MNQNISNVILKPVITEKSTALSKHNKYTFLIARGATKDDVKSVFKEIFPDRKVLDIQTLKIKGHKKRTKGGYKLPVDKKKVIITISGAKLEFFPEVS